MRRCAGAAGRWILAGVLALGTAGVVSAVDIRSIERFLARD